jgi:hypothetical protein
MAERRLCGKSAPETQVVMRELKKTLSETVEGKLLADEMLTKCERYGKCFERKPCGRNKK